MSLSLERAEEGGKGWGRGAGQSYVCAYQLSFLLGQAFPGHWGVVWESGRLAGPRGCLSRRWPASSSACLSSPLPHHPNPSSGYVQAAGLKSDPGGRRPFLLIRNQYTLPRISSSPIRPPPHPGSLSWGHPLPLVTNGQASSSRFAL